MNQGADLGADRDLGTESAVVIGVGNEFRRDDGLGPAVLAELRAGHSGETDPDTGSGRTVLARSDGEPSQMIDLWDGVGLAVVVDAVRDPRVPPGHLYELSVGALPATVGAASSHAIDLGETVALAQVLGRMPARLVVLAVAGADFSFGTGLSPRVAAAVPTLSGRVRQLLREHRLQPHPIGVGHEEEVS